MFNRNKQTNRFKSTFNGPFSTNFISQIPRKRQKLNKKLQFSQHSIDIDPWHINSDITQNQSKKFKNIHDRLSNRRQLLTSQKKYMKNSSFETLNQEINKYPFHSSPHQDEICSPTKNNMLECSFRFQEYENLKAQEIQSKFINQFQKITNQCQNQNYIQDTKTKNFIQRNIKNAFFIENQISMSHINPKTDKKKTICEQTKEKLLLNNEKLDRSSKQLQKFISMKDSSPKGKKSPQKQLKFVYKVPIESKWNLSYVEKQPNPQQNHYKNRKFHNLLLKNRGKSQEVKKRDFIKNKVYFDEKSNKSQKQMSRRLSRLFKVKNRSTLIIQNNSDQMKFVNHPDQESYRIHSLTPNKKNETINSKGTFTIKLQRQISSPFQRAEIQISEKSVNRQHQRSFSANIIKRTNSPYEQKQVSKHMKVKPHQKVKQYVITKNLYLEGKQCSLTHFALE